MDLTRIDEVKIVNNTTSANIFLQNGWLLLGVETNNHPIKIVLGKKNNDAEEFIDKIISS